MHSFLMVVHFYVFFQDWIINCVCIYIILKTLNCIVLRLGGFITMSCFVRNCKNIRRLMPLDSQITFHRFPKDDIRFREWLCGIDLGWNLDNIKWSESMFICSEHFYEQDFANKIPRAVLKKSAVPHLSTRHPSDLTENIEIDHIPRDIPSCSKSFTPASFVMDFSNIIEERQSPVLENVFLTAEKVGKPTLTVPSPLSENVSRQDKSLKRKLLLIKTKSMSSGSDSSIDRKRKVIKTEHSYSVSPRTAKKRLDTLKAQFYTERQKVYRAKQRIKKMKKRVKSMKDVINHLKSRYSLSSRGIDHLNLASAEVPLSLFNRIHKSSGSKTVTRQKFPEELRKFAVTLHFYSAKAYDYVRKTFNLALPHPSTIRKWCSSIECDPGFSKPCFDAIAQKVKEAERKNEKVICSVLIDEMSIKKQVEFDGRRNWGYVDVGVNIDTDELDPATEALVIMVVCNISSWKLPTGYFLIKSMTGAEKANVVNEAITRLSEIGVEVTSVTCDGPSAHFAMFQKLGCDFNMANIKTYFPHPVDPNKKIYAIFDACHMLKLMRNCLGTLGTLIDPQGDPIQWAYIDKLHTVQENENFSLANKLGKTHMQWEKQKIKVKLAAQTLSNSVAEALLFLKEDLKLPEFQGCAATVEFIKKIDKLFDILNSRVSWEKGFKSPLKEENEQQWRPFIESSIVYLKNIKTSEGKFVWETTRKTPFLGFIITLKSIVGIFDNFVKTGKLKYLLTYKHSQDHLELFFCSIRSRNGWNNNPSALQFMRTYRKLILHAKVAGYGGNCRVLDTTTVLTISSGLKKVSVLDEVDISCIRKNAINFDSEVLRDHDYDIIPNHIGLSEYAENVVSYISGYVLKMMKKSVFCEDCLELLLETNIDGRNFALMRRRNLGPYLFPSNGVIKTCKETELFIRHLMYITKNSLPSPDLVKEIITYVSRKLFSSITSMFIDHPEHSFILLKSIIFCYCKIRLHNLAKKYTVKIQGDLVRKKLNKIILFSHQ